MEIRAEKDDSVIIQVLIGAVVTVKWRKPSEARGVEKFQAANIL
jgi:hypothetical protein